MKMHSLKFKIFRNLSRICAVLALLVVVLGAYVRLTDAGLGCPDWPGCYGTMTVPQSVESIQKAQITYPDKIVEVGKAWREMLHRYLAGTLGSLVLLMWSLSIAVSKEMQTSAWLTTTVLCVIALQAMLGMWTVTLLLKPVVVSLHLLGGMTTLALLTWIAHRHWGYYSGSILSSHGLTIAIRFGLLILFLQIMLGGWTSTNYAALACTDFPTCHGAWWPNMDFKEGFHLFRNLNESRAGGALTLSALTAAQWTHRIGALVTLLYLGTLALKLMKYWQFKSLAVLLLITLLLQVALGIANLLLHLPLVLAVAHNFTAALLVIIMVILNSKVTGK